MKAPYEQPAIDSFTEQELEESVEALGGTGSNGIG